MNNIVNIQNLTKTYDKGRTIALNGLNLSIREGVSISITGPSGSGKSTLLNMIGALDIPDEGLVEIAGQDISKIKDLNKFRRETVGFVFQLHNLIPNITTRENVELPMFEMGMNSQQMKEHAQKLLKSVGLENKADKKPNILSGGERQRVAVARALVNNPRIILADEPTGSLDSENGQIIMDLLKYHQKKLGTTLIIVTHDTNIAKQTQLTIKLKDGQITGN